MEPAHAVALLMPDENCRHVDEVADLLDPEVTGDSDLEPDTDTRRTK